MYVYRRIPISSTESSPTAFTLIELIIVIIIVGVLAALGISQYSLMVEKGRLAEAKQHIGVMRQLAYEYYLNNGTVATLTNSDVGVDYTCTSNDYYRYQIGSPSATRVDLGGRRCTSGGKSPDATREWDFFVRFHPDTGQTTWCCFYLSDNSPCFGYPSHTDPACN